MNKENSKISIYAPILFAIIFAVGIIIGNKLNFQNNNNSISFKSEPNKLDLILNLIKSDYVDEVSISNIVENAVPEILKNLDPHSIYIPAKDFKRVNEPLEGNFDGIGVQFNILKDTILVINTISGGPAEKVGLLAGDKIITINDSIFAGKGISNNDVIKNLKGERGTKVKVGIKRTGYKKLLNFDIVRNIIPLYSVDVSYMINKETGYIKISQFARTTYDEFLLAVNKLHQQGMTKIVLDLRSNTGGYLDAAVNIIDEFLEKNKLIVYTQGKARPRSDYKSSEKGICKNDELVVLIDSWSASASEIVAGAIQDNDRGTIIGRRSFGKGLVQESNYFRDGSAIRLTIARYYTPTGRSIQKPYTKGKDEYQLDLVHRFEHGEFKSADSTQFADSLKFVTKGGKVVYGGGGIMPDIFVAIDTIGVTPYFQRITNRALIYTYALEYTNNNRKKLSKHTDYKHIVKYLKSKNILNSFIDYAKRKGIKPNHKDIKISKKILETRIYAYIARNLIDNDGYYPIIKNIDATLQRAEKVFEK